MRPLQPIRSIVIILSLCLLLGVSASCGTSDQAPSTTPISTTTIAGLDANADGVRDDIEVYLDTTYPVPGQNEINKALRQYAKAVQSSMIHADDSTLSVTHATERFRALECLMAKRPGDFHPIFVDLRARLLDTTARSNAYLHADTQVKAVTIPLLPMDQWGTACLE